MNADGKSKLFCRCALRKRGQSEMMETFMVIVVVVILLIFGLFVYYSFFMESLGKKGEKVAEESTIAMLSAAASMPEINCYGKYSCVDISKAMAFKKHLETEKEGYKHFFEGRMLRIKIVYPKPKVEKECSYADYQQDDFPANCNMIVVYDGVERNKDTARAKQVNIFGFPTSIYLPFKNRYILGRVEMVYTKQV